MAHEDYQWILEAKRIVSFPEPPEETNLANRTVRGYFPVVLRYLACGYLLR
jgi:hypothetical protein